MRHLRRDPPALAAFQVDEAVARHRPQRAGQVGLRLAGDPCQFVERAKPLTVTLLGLPELGPTASAPLQRDDFDRQISDQATSLRPQCDDAPRLPCAIPRLSAPRRTIRIKKLSEGPWWDICCFWPILSHWAQYLPKRAIFSVVHGEKITTICSSIRLAPWQAPATDMKVITSRGALGTCTLKKYSRRHILCTTVGALGTAATIGGASIPFSPRPHKNFGVGALFAVRPCPGERRGSVNAAIIAISDR